MHLLLTFFMVICSSLAMADSSFFVENSFEVVPPNEKDEILRLTQMIAAGVKDRRDAHAKAHGCVGDVKVNVRDDLPEIYRVGFFASPGKTYDAIARFSSGSGDQNAKDPQGGVQGLALKLLLDSEDQKKIVPLYGEDKHYVEDQYYKSFDILTVSVLKEFFIENVHDYFAFFGAKSNAEKTRQFALKDGKTPEQADQIAQKIFATIFVKPPLGKQRLREAQLLGQAGKAKPTNLLGEVYGSGVPSLLGQNHAVKYQITPCSGPSVSTDPVDPSQPNFLGEQLKKSLVAADACFKLSLQLYKEEMGSIEDAVATWSETVSPYVEVATIFIPQKATGQELIDTEICEKASFHPGHTSKDHFPIGGIQRARVGGKDYEGIYTAIHRARNEYKP